MWASRWFSRVNVASKNGRWRKKEKNGEKIEEKKRKKWKNKRKLERNGKKKKENTEQSS